MDSDCTELLRALIGLVVEDASDKQVRDVALAHGSEQDQTKSKKSVARREKYVRHLAKQGDVRDGTKLSTGDAEFLRSCSDNIEHTPHFLEWSEEADEDEEQ